jgi:uncharacterized protein YjbJ (UPF0337 family)
MLAEENVMENIGVRTSLSSLAAEGQSEKFAGKIQKKVGRIKKVFEK